MVVELSLTLRIHQCPQPCISTDVRFGSKADIAIRPRHVRFTPESGHRLLLRFSPFEAVIQVIQFAADPLREPATISAVSGLRVVVNVSGWAAISYTRPARGGLGTRARSTATLATGCLSRWPF